MVDEFEFDVGKAPQLTQRQIKYWDALMLRGLGETDYLELAPFNEELLDIARHIGYLRALESITELESGEFSVTRFVVDPPFDADSTHPHLEAAQIFALAEVARWQIGIFNAAKESYGLVNEGTPAAGESSEVDPATETD